MLLTFWWTVVGLCGSLVSVTSASLLASFNQHLFDKRYLQQQQPTPTSSRACGDVVGTVSKEEVAFIAGLFVNATLIGPAAAFLPQAEKVLLGSIEYDLQVIKICGSCKAAQTLYNGETFLNDSSAYGSYQSYCGKGVYGYDAEHSALMFVPLDGQGGPPLIGQLSSLVLMHGFATNVSHAPTELWPTNVTQFLQSANKATILLTLFDFLETLLGSASGAITVVPDYLGFGESLTSHNRTPFWQESYMQAAVQSWLAASRELQNRTNDCTVMSNTITFSGASEGGYGAIAAGSAFYSLGKNVLQIFGNAPFMTAEAAAVNAVRLLSSKNMSYSSGLPDLLAFSAWTGSWGNPELVNTGSGQESADPSYLNSSNVSHNILTWYASPDPLPLVEVESFYPDPVFDLLNPSALQLLQNGLAMNTYYPCNISSLVTKGVNDKICALLNQFTIFEAVAKLNISTSLCFSPNDTIVPVQSFPDFLFNNSNVNNLSEIVPGVIMAMGDHGEAIILCKINAVLFFTNANGSPGSPNLIKLLNNTDKQLQCSNGGTGGGGMGGSSAPAAAPTGSSNARSSMAGGLLLYAALIAMSALLLF